MTNVESERRGFTIRTCATPNKSDKASLRIGFTNVVTLPKSTRICAKCACFFWITIEPLQLKNEIWLPPHTLVTSTTTLNSLSNSQEVASGSVWRIDWTMQQVALVAQTVARKVYRVKATYRMVQKMSCKPKKKGKKSGVYPLSLRFSDETLLPLYNWK